MTESALKFLARLAHNLPSEERLILCGFVGDPNTAEPSDWRPRPWQPSTGAPPFGRKANAYVTVSSFARAPDDSFRRRQSTFAAGRALMVDDVGTKVDRATAAALKPSAIVETSKGNEQHWYFLLEPERDQQRFDGLIRAFIAGRLLGTDPGMSGVTRVGRLPGFTNGKPVNDGWVCALLELNDKRYSIEELLSAFNLSIEGRAPPPRAIPKDVALSRVRAFDTVFSYLDRSGLLKRSKPDLSGWTEMTCPWVDDHTGAADTGAAVREPMPENSFYGAFRCHHGHCISKGWAELTEWVADQAIDRLATINAAAPRSLKELRK